ncbi:MAG TPA: DUF4388 domain-containing protein [Candidatus Limnocylindria bacterium]|nr:DUF4388 domain-containing protein [Candidatus Limnocylindria bacterium]
MTPQPGTIHGELGLIGLFDLGQLLTLNGATGCLVVQTGDRKGYLYFAGGHLVNAVDDTFQEGEGAAYHVFGWREGTFEFQPETSADSRTIEIGTDALMLEAARRLDESEQAAGEGTGGRVAKVREHQIALEALRDVFERVTGEARLAGAGGETRLAGAGGEARSPTAHLYALSRPGDRLVYRAGRPPRLKLNQAWREVDEPTLAPEAYQDIRARLMDSGVADSAPGTTPERRRPIELADGRVIGIEIVSEGADEALWLRPIALPAPDLARLDGDFESLEGILAVPEGLVLVGGPDVESARWLFHGVLAALACQHAGTVLLATHDATYRHDEVGGVVLRTPPHQLAAAMRAVQPDTVALDPDLPPGEARLEDLELVPHVVAGVVSPDAASLVPRWLARLAPHDPRLSQACFATTPFRLIMTGLAEGAPAFFVRTLDGKERALALSGQTEALAALLVRPAAGQRLELHRS